MTATMILLSSEIKNEDNRFKNKKFKFKNNSDNIKI